MESNKDDSEKCLELANNYLRFGEIEQALKYLRKAQRLYPLQRTRELIDNLLSANPEAADNEGVSQQEVFDSSGGDEDFSSGAQIESKESVHPKYNAEQLHAVEQISGCKDYYDILGVTRDCTDDDLKKAYKKLALKFHPDKNHAPGSTDAFKAIVNALAVLSDPIKCRHYNEFGIDEERSRTSSSTTPPTSSSYMSNVNHRTSAYASHDYYDYDFMRRFDCGDISAEDFFRQFFDSARSSAPKFSRSHGKTGFSHRSYGPQSSWQQATRQQASPTSKQSPRSTGEQTSQASSHERASNPNSRRSSQRQRPHEYMGLYEFLFDISPLVFIAGLFLLSMLLQVLVREIPYSLQSDSVYNIARITSRLEVPYYLSDEESVGVDGVDAIDRRVESEYLETLESQCLEERSKIQKETRAQKARIFRNGHEIKNSKKSIGGVGGGRTGSCELLQAVVIGSRVP